LFGIGKENGGFFSEWVVSCGLSFCLEFGIVEFGIVGCFTDFGLPDLGLPQPASVEVKIRMLTVLWFLD